MDLRARLRPDERGHPRRVRPRRTGGGLRHRLAAHRDPAAGYPPGPGGRTVGGSMATIEQSVEVAVPVRTAYNQWTQFETFPAFMEGVEEVRQLDDTHLHWVVEHNGRRHEFDAEITEQRPDERVAWRTTDGKSHA